MPELLNLVEQRQQQPGFKVVVFFRTARQTQVSMR
jgi:hypothetical protein